MKQQIEQLKKEIQEFLDLEKLATSGPWDLKFDSSGFPGVSRNDDLRIVNTDLSCSLFGLREADSRFIAASRNISPAMAKMLLVAVDGLENVTTWNLEVGDRCRIRLAEILSIWEGARR